MQTLRKTLLNNILRPTLVYSSSLYMNVSQIDFPFTENQTQENNKNTRNLERKHKSSAGKSMRACMAQLECQRIDQRSTNIFGRKSIA